jgi:hypothetical protein
MSYVYGFGRFVDRMITDFDHLMHIISVCLIGYAVLVVTVVAYLIWDALKKRSLRSKEKSDGEAPDLQKRLL